MRHRFGRFVLAALALVSLTSSAFAGITGGTFTNGGAPSTTWPNLSQILSSPKQYNSTPDPSATNSAQGFTTQDGSATGAILAEIVTPTTTFNLDTISMNWAGAGTIPTGLSLHLFSLGSATTPLSALASQSSAFYFVNADLLGGGAGLAFPSGGVTQSSLINFTLDNVGTSDQVTLNAGTSYAVELWNQTSAFNQTALTWNRNSVADPNGQGFGKQNTTNAASRNTLAALGLAGGAPRTFQIALYGNAVPEPASIALLGIGAVGLFAAAMKRRRK